MNTRRAGTLVRGVSVARHASCRVFRVLRLRLAFRGRRERLDAEVPVSDAPRNRHILTVRVTGRGRDGEDGVDEPAEAVSEGAAGSLRAWRRGEGEGGRGRDVHRGQLDGHGAAGADEAASARGHLADAEEEMRALW